MLNARSLRRFIMVGAMCSRPFGARLAVPVTAAKDDDMDSSRTVCTALLATLACAAPVAMAQTLEKIASSNRITVGYREASVPFSYLAGSPKAVGFAVDLTEAIVDEVKQQLNRPALAVQYLAVTGQNRIPLLVDGSYDLECGSTTHTSAREKDVAFSVNYFYTGTRLLTKKGSGIRGMADLAKKTVATTAGSTNEKVLRKEIADRGLDTQVLASKDYADGLADLQADKAAALALDDVLLFGLRANAPDPAALEVVGEALQVEPYGCMVRRNDPAFKALVDRTIGRLMSSGEFTRLYAKWFESPIPPKGANLAMPMSDTLKANLREQSDKAAF
jgi:ABC-type amino acid transport substrate-binding protein